MKLTKNITPRSDREDQGELPSTNVNPRGASNVTTAPSTTSGTKSTPVQIKGSNGFGGSDTQIPHFLRRENICLNLEFELPYDFSANPPRSPTPSHKLISEKAYKNMQPALHLVDFVFRWSKPFFLRLLDAPTEHFYSLAGTPVRTFSDSWKPSPDAETNYATALSYSTAHARVFALEPAMSKQAWAAASADFRYGAFRLVLEVHTHFLDFYASDEYATFSQRAKDITHVRLAINVVHEMAHLFYKIRRALLLGQGEANHDPAALARGRPLDDDDKDGVVARTSEREPKLGLWDTTKTDRGELGRAWEHLVLGGGPMVRELYGACPDFEVSRSLDIRCRVDEDYSFRVRPAEIRALVDPAVQRRLLASMGKKVMVRGKGSMLEFERYEKVSVLWRALDAIKGGIPLRHKWLEGEELSEDMEELRQAREVEEEILSRY